MGTRDGWPHATDTKDAGHPLAYFLLMYRHAWTAKGKTVTVAEARSLLAKLPDALPLCFALSDCTGIIVEIAKIDLVPVTVEGNGYVAAFDDAPDGATRVAVVR